ncbi:MAG TPA: tetratricopeptide repeat protein, partial [Emticicia sp.]
KTFLYLIPVGIGALAKPPAVMFAPILFFYITLFEKKLSLTDFFRAANFKQVGKSILEVIPAFVFCGLMYWWVDKFTPHTWQAGGNSPLLYLITQPFVIGYYFVTLFFPIHLSADTDWQLLSNIWNIRFFIGCVFIVLMLWVAIFTSKKTTTRPISFGILWFFLALIPTSSIIPLAEVMNDHRMYFPFVGLILSVIWTIGLILMKYQTFYQKYATFIFSGIGIILVAYAVGTYQRNKVWATEETLWYDVTVKSPGNSRGLMNYGLSKMGKGEYTEADKYFTQALVLAPDYPTLHINMGVLKEATGDKLNAEQYFKSALAANSLTAEPWFFYGRFLFNQLRYSEASPYLSKAIEISPAYLPARELLMKIYDQQEDFAKLKALAESTLQIAPASIDAQLFKQSAELRKSQLALQRDEVSKNPSPEKFLNLGLAYYQVGKYKESIEVNSEAIQLNPDYAEAYNNIGSAYNLLKEYDKAQEYLKKAIQLKPDFQLAKNNLAVAENSINEVGNAEKLAQQKPSPENYISLSLVYFNHNMFEKCIEACKKALTLKPDYDLAYNNICAAYNRLKQW